MLILLIILINATSLWAQEDSTKVASQNPSPMQEYTRPHEKIKQTEFPGKIFKINDLLWKPLEVFIPPKVNKSKKMDLLIHFHGGSSSPAKYAAEKYNKGPIVSAAVSLGSGSRIYYNQFNDSALFARMIDSIQSGVTKLTGHKIEVKHIILSGFSAGYGAIKRILSYPVYYKQISGVILLDGIHTSYIPDRKVIFEGGKIDSAAFDIFLKLAMDASDKRSDKKFLITHSEVFPGTFVSTTEATDYLIRQLHLKRKPVLKWGPFGMQQISDIRNNNFRVMGFAGNSGPDHIDHFQSLYYFLNVLE